MEKRDKQDLSALSCADKLDRVREQRKQAARRYRQRQKAKQLGLSVPKKLYINESKTEQEIKQRKNELDRFNRANKTVEERQQYLEKERERKRVARNKNLNFEEEILDFNPEGNKHYLNRYFKLIKSDFSKYTTFEKHHVLPKSLFPQYRLNDCNIINLPVKAHFLAHWLLAKIFPKSREMLYALFMMKQTRIAGKSFMFKGNLYNSISELQNYLVSTKQHHFTDSKFQSKVSKNRVENGEHHFQGGHIQTRSNSERLSNGSHNLLRKNNTIHKRTAEGKNPLSGFKPWNHYNATNSSKEVWRLADVLYEYYLNNPQNKYTKIVLDFQTPFAKMPIQNLLKRFRSGWVPTEDPDWMRFKYE